MQLDIITVASVGAIFFRLDHKLAKRPEPEQYVVSIDFGTVRLVMCSMLDKNFGQSTPSTSFGESTRANFP